MLNSYLTDTATLLNDPNNQFWSTNTLTALINRARRWLSVRTGYPRVLVTTLSTVANQEAYPISLANAAVAATSGVASPFGWWGISVAQTTYMVALGRKPWPEFMADERILNDTLQNYPDRFSSYGRGSAASAYMFPVPSGVFAMWWDLACTPINLMLDTDPEAIPLPWTEVVPFLAAGYAYKTQRRWTDADEMDDEVDRMFAEASAAELPFMQPDWYPNSR